MPFGEVTCRHRCGGCGSSPWTAPAAAASSFFGMRLCGDIIGLKAALPAELAGLEQGDQIVQLAQIVLHRRGGEQQAVFFADAALTN